MQFQDIVSLIALFVGIFAVMVVPFAIYIENGNRRLRKAHEILSRNVMQVELHNKAIQESAHSMCDLTNSVNSRELFLGAMIEILLVEQKVPNIRIESYRRSTTRFSEAINSSLNDLLLFGACEKDRLSAFQKAADSLGTLMSLRKMQISAELHPTQSVEYTKYIRVLQQRLERRDKNGTHHG